LAILALGSAVTINPGGYSGCVATTVAAFPPGNAHPIEIRVRLVIEWIPDACAHRRFRYGSGTQQDALADKRIEKTALIASPSAHGSGGNFRCHRFCHLLTTCFISTNSYQWDGGTGGKGFSEAMTTSEIEKFRAVSDGSWI
jgi:hypothetical protein